ncbi:MAG: M1 family metallopeptidase [Bacteroidetes bacterium]|nr:M1 family metallopeptidase [Bacteroidota bacterium]
MKKWLILFFLAPSLLYAQPNFFDTFTFTRADSLRGKITEQRDYDVFFYDLSVAFNIEEQSITGENQIHFTVPAKRNRIQVDLFENLAIESIKLFGKTELPFKREGNVIFIDYETFKPKKKYWITVAYSGSPIIAKKPPWDGGFIWTNDTMTGKPWVAVACEGLGASSWWPCKDHLSDEPDSMHLHYTVPKDLVAVANGKQAGETNPDQLHKTYHWHIHYPINSYNVTFYIGDYVSMEYPEKFYYPSGGYFSENPDFEPPSFWVINSRDSINKWKFDYHYGNQVLMELEVILCPYPFELDGYKLVEAPYWGMEHQSAIAYGNNQKLNEFWFDFITLHESGHEWFGNLISCGDHADLWIHEAFTTYLEAMFLEHDEEKYSTSCAQPIPFLDRMPRDEYFKQKAIQYLNTQRAKIKNQMPIKGPYNVNFNAWPDADMYYKGTWMLHTLRTLVENDSLWFETIRGMTKEFAFKPVYTKDVVEYLSRELDKDLTDFFNQYLNYASLPKIEYYFTKSGDQSVLHYRYAGELEAFDAPVRYFFNDELVEYQWLFPTREWKTQELTIGNSKDFNWDVDHFLIDFEKVKR